jgi:nitroreductase
MTPDFLSVITQRHCKRAFLDRQVEGEVLEKVLRAAAHAPSTRNTQLWRVEVLTGAAKERLAERLCADFENDVPTRHDYVNRPAQLGPEHEERARLAGATCGTTTDFSAPRRP